MSAFNLDDLTPEQKATLTRIREILAGTESTPPPGPLPEAERGRKSALAPVSS